MWHKEEGKGADLVMVCFGIFIPVENTPKLYQHDIEFPVTDLWEGILTEIRWQR